MEKYVDSSSTPGFRPLERESATTNTTWRARRGAITAPSVHLFLASGHGAQALRVGLRKIESLAGLKHWLQKKT